MTFFEQENKEELICKAIAKTLALQILYSFTESEFKQIVRGETASEKYEVINQVCNFVIAVFWDHKEYRKYPLQIHQSGVMALPIEIYNNLKSEIHEIFT